MSTQKWRLTGEQKAYKIGLRAVNGFQNPPIAAPPYNTGNILNAKYTI